MKLNEVYTLLQAIRTCQSAFPSNPPIKFSYCLARNAKLLESEIATAQDIINKDIDMESLQSYERRRQELLVQHAKKDDEGRPVIVDDQFQISQGEANKIQKTLRDEFPKAQDMLALRGQRAFELGEQEVSNLPLYKLDLALWPDVPAQTMNDLMVLVED